MKNLLTTCPVVVHLPDYRRLAIGDLYSAPSSDDMPEQRCSNLEATLAERLAAEG